MRKSRVAVIAFALAAQGASAESFWVNLNPDGSLTVEHDREAFVSLIPSLGIRWTL